MMFDLVNVIADPADPHDLEIPAADRPLPSELADLWNICRSARLFADDKYGQWGLELLDPVACARFTRESQMDRPTDFRADDLVIGRFIGDSELLVMAPSEKGSRRLLVALPLYPRDDWYETAPDLVTFLSKYLAARGEKYWEEVDT